MTRFLALYSGSSVADAKLIIATSDPAVVHDFADRLLREWPGDPPDPVDAEVHGGRRRALELVREEAADEEGDP